MKLNIGTGNKLKRRLKNYDLRTKAKTLHKAPGEGRHGDAGKTTCREG